MIRRLLVTIMIGLFSVPLAAQSAYIEFSYQSFKPFVHFQLNLSNSYSYSQDPYEAAYLKGYMDGVNDAYYNDYRFYDLVRDIDIYEAGYRDGYRDRDLMIHLRGRDWYHRHRFVYNDYHSPYYSVQIWLSGLSLAFLQAPEHRLPRHWKRRAHPRFKKYRQWYKQHHYFVDNHYYDDDEYRRYALIEKRYDKRVKRLRKDAHKERSRYQKQKDRDGYRTDRIERVSKVDKRKAQQRLRQPRQKTNRSRIIQNSRRHRTIGNTSAKAPSNKRIETRSRVNKNRGTSSNKNTNVKKRSNNRQPETLRTNNRKKENNKRTVRKTNNRKKNNGSVKRNSKSSEKSKSRRGDRNRSSNNGRGN